MGRSGNKFPAKKALPEFYGIELSLAAGKKYFGPLALHAYEKQAPTYRHAGE